MTSRVPTTAQPEAEQWARGRRGMAVLWFGFLAGPLAWMFHLAASYLLVPYACAHGLTILIHLVSLLALALAATGGGVSLFSWRRMGQTLQLEAGGPLGRSRFMAASGVANALGFGLVILGQWIPAFLMDPCY
jgi:hypothetical protein